MELIVDVLGLIDETIWMLLQVPVFSEILLTMVFFAILGLFIKAKNAAKR